MKCFITLLYEWEDVKHKVMSFVCSFLKQAPIWIGQGGCTNLQKAARRNNRSWHDTETQQRWSTGPHGEGKVGMYIKRDKAAKSPLVRQSKRHNNSGLKMLWSPSGHLSWSQQRPRPPALLAPIPFQQTPTTSKKKSHNKTWSSSWSVFSLQLLLTSYMTSAQNIRPLEPALCSGNFSDRARTKEPGDDSGFQPSHQRAACQTSAGAHPPRAGLRHRYCLLQSPTSVAKRSDLAGISQKAAKSRIPLTASGSDATYPSAGTLCIATSEELIRC